MIVPGDIAELINGNIEEISQDGTVRFSPFVKDEGETTIPTKRRRTSSVSLTDDPILGFNIAMRYIFQFLSNTNVRHPKNYERLAENQRSGHIRHSPNIRHIHRTFGKFPKVLPLSCPFAFSPPPPVPESA